MNHKQISTSFLNFTAVLILLLIIAAPFFIARNITKVAGVKTESLYLITPQIDRFPNVTFTQKEQNYYLSYSKLGQSQAYTAVLILTNPTPSSHLYEIVPISGYSKVFFGEDFVNQKTQVILPSGSSMPLSLFSDSFDQSPNPIVEFKINTR